MHTVLARPQSARRSALRIAATYTLIAIAWITLSDRSIELLTRNIEVMGQLQTMKGGLFVGITGVVLWLLISRALEQLQASERCYHALFQASQDAVFVVDRAGRILDANTSAVALCGYSVAELQPTPASVVLPEHGRLQAQSSHPSLASHSVIREQLRTKAGRLVAVELKINDLLFDQQSASVYIVRDISEQQKSMADLEQSERRFQSLFEAAPVGIATSRNGLTMSANPAYLRLFGFDDISEIEGTSLLNQIAPEFRSEIIERNRRREAGEQVISSYETVGLRKDGSTFSFSADVARVEQAEGPTTILFAADITERKQVEETLRVSEATNRALLDAIPDLMFRISQDGFFLGYESADTERLAVPADAFIGKRIDEVLPVNVAEQALVQLRHVISSGEMQRFEYQLPLDTGDSREYEARLVLSGHAEVLAIVRDITEHNQMERTLRESEARQQAILHGTSDTIFLKDRLGRYLLINPAGAAIFGRPIEEIIGKTDDELFPPAIAQRATDTDRMVIDNQEALEVENTFLVNERERSFLVMKGPYRHGDGTVQGVIGVARDITERKRQEQIKDDFLALASHELKTPLAALLGYIYLLERWSAKNGFGDRVDHALAAMSHEGKRLDRLINDLLDVSRIQTGRLQMDLRTIELRSYVEQVLVTMRLAIADHPIVLIDDADRELPCLADPQRLEQVISNLLTNAAKYSSEGAPIYVELQSRQHSIEIAVRDTGIGIPEADVPLIFDRFYQVQRPRRESRPGMGLGLFITREIVRQHGGTLGVDSREGAGSRFSIQLPLAAETIREVTLDSSSIAHPSAQSIEWTDRRRAGSG